jgi:hypothetical protein
MVCSTLNCLRVTAVLDQICPSLMSVLPTDEQLSMFLSVTRYIAFGLRHPDVCPGTARCPHAYACEDFSQISSLKFIDYT